MKEVVVVERVLEVPTQFAELQAREEAFGWCFQQHGVEPLCSYLEIDGPAAVCIYRAPDADAVRASQRQASMQFERVWTAGVYGSPVPPDDLQSVIVVQRDFDEPVALQLVEDTLARGGHCLGLHRARLLASHLARDGRRMVCVFEAPDAESVRIANRQLQMPVTRAWPGRIVLGAPPK